MLYRYGDPVDTLYLIWEGRLHLSMTHSLGALEPGQMVGVAEVIAPGPALATVTAATPCILLRLDHASLQNLRQTDPELGGLLLRNLSTDLVERLRAYEKSLSQQGWPANDDAIIHLGRQLMEIKTA